jgi:hypothetical protein
VGFIDLKKSKGKIPGEVSLVTLTGIHKVNQRLVAIYEKLFPIIQELTKKN